MIIHINIHIYVQIQIQREVDRYEGTLWFQGHESTVVGRRGNKWQTVWEEPEAERSHVQPHAEIRELELFLGTGYKLSKSAPIGEISPVRLHDLPSSIVSPNVHLPEPMWGISHSNHQTLWRLMCWRPTYLVILFLEILLGEASPEGLGHWQCVLGAESCPKLLLAPLHFPAVTS